jgi:hypothetical protein
MRTTVLLLSCALFTSLVAQIPAYELNFVSREDEHHQRESKLVNARFANYGNTSQYEVYVEMESAGKSKGQFRIWAFDRSTGTLAGKSTSNPSWGSSFLFDKLFSVDDRLYLIYEDTEKRSGKMAVYAHEISLPDAILTGEPKLLATLEFDPKSYYGGSIDAQFHVSGNSEHVIFFFDRIRSKENEQLVLISMLNKELDLQWEQGYRIAFDSEKISTWSVAVGDNGIIYSLMSARFKNRAIRNKEINYNFEVFGLSEKGMSSQGVDIPSDRSAVAARMALRNGRIPVVIGSYIEEKQSTSETAGYFIAECPELLDAPPTIAAYKFPSVLKERIYRMDMWPRSGGGFFAVMGSLEQNYSNIQESNLAVISFSNTNDVEWINLLPRDLRTNNTDLESYLFSSFLLNDELLVVFPDSEENLQRYKNGSELKTTTKPDRIFIAAGFDDKGKPSFEKFGKGTQYDFFPRDGYSNKGTANGTYVFGASRTIGKKAEYGVLFLNGVK